MKPIFIESTEEIRGQWERVVLHSRLPNGGVESCPIEACYRKGKAGLEQYIRETLLPGLENVSAQERRHYRLHRRSMEVFYWCTGEVTQERFWSVRLKIRESLSADEKEWNILRVWELEKGCLCPLEFFLADSQAKKYQRWEFAVEDERLWVYPRKGGGGEWIRSKASRG
ncbi:MAG: hypothetical protein IKC59_00200 [Clostridia bacterium]|nr:hypothetical protein [Clostridia bacterium]